MDMSSFMSTLTKIFEYVYKIIKFLMGWSDEDTEGEPESETNA